MTIAQLVSQEPIFIGYIAAFSVAAIACLASLPRTREIEDAETRKGLVGLLVVSASWSVAHVGFLVVPSIRLKYLFYLAGLIVGLATIGPWLYFCSAYSGRSLHRNPRYRYTAIVVFLAIVVVKVTNQFHQQYFTAEFTTTPFPHLAIQHQPLHWLVMGLVYGLALVGYFMLFERFTQVSYDTAPLLALVGITGLPLFLDLIGFTTPVLLDITHEPLGVAVFAVGVSFAFHERFQTVQLAGDHEDPVIVLDGDDQIREFNDMARRLFPQLGTQDVIGEPIDEVVPDATEALESDSQSVAVQRDDGTHYFQVSDSPFAAGQTQLGRLLVFTDITERERYRRELERQNERLEQFASMVSHDLRNPLNVATGRLGMINEDLDNEHVDATRNALDRMETLIDDLLTLARQGQPIDELEPVLLGMIAEQCWAVIDVQEAEIVIEDDLTILADGPRLQQLLENLFRNSLEHGGAAVTIRIGALDNGSGFYVEDDGPGIPAADREEIFESGFSTNDDGTGFGLAIVKEIVEAHGWSIRATEAATGGARFEITGVERVD
ncbi:MAG: ATP-binding protein [Halobacteriales archaeon]|nr:ATP-binding protein [Halobacteriales archaeon]